jgi:hypothetical protein
MWLVPPCPYTKLCSDLYKKGVPSRLVHITILSTKKCLLLSQTWHTITVFILCMLLNPEIQAKAQKEIDTVVGRGRLPDFTDRDALPYVECVIQETMRYECGMIYQTCHIADTFIGGSP